MGLTMGSIVSSESPQLYRPSTTFNVPDPTTIPASAFRQIPVVDDVNHMFPWQAPTNVVGTETSRRMVANSQYYDQMIALMESMDRDMGDQFRSAMTTEDVSECVRPGTEYDAASDSEEVLWQ